MQLPLGNMRFLLFLFLLLQTIIMVRFLFLVELLKDLLLWMLLPVITVRLELLVEPLKTVLFLLLMLLPAIMIRLVCPGGPSQNRAVFVFGAAASHYSED